MSLEECVLRCANTEIKNKFSQGQQNTFPLWKK